MASYAEAVKVRDAWIAEMDATPKGAVKVDATVVTLKDAMDRYFAGKLMLSRAVQGAVERGQDAAKTVIARNFLSAADRLYDGLGAGWGLARGSRRGSGRNDGSIAAGSGEAGGIRPSSSASPESES